MKIAETSDIKNGTHEPVYIMTIDEIVELCRDYTNNQYDMSLQGCRDDSKEYLISKLNEMNDNGTDRRTDNH